MSDRAGIIGVVTDDEQRDGDGVPPDLDEEKAAAVLKAAKAAVEGQLSGVRKVAAGLSMSQLDSLRRIRSEAFKGLKAAPTEVFEPILPKPPMIDPIDISAIPHDSSPQETAENTARAAQAAERQSEAVDKLVELTGANLAASKDQREQAERTERYTKKISRWSIGLAAASTVASFAALGVSIVALFR